MIDTEIIISINVHEKCDFLLKQIQNICENINYDHYIILNCNQYMFDSLNNMVLPKNIIICPEIIEKKRFHGSLMKGIYTNMKYAVERFRFSYFMILSSRNVFFKKLDIDDLNNRLTLCDDINKYINTIDTQIYNNWHWPTMKKTLLARYYLEKKLPLRSSAHEGLIFHKNVCENIIFFLESNIIIRDQVFNSDCCAEEFGLQTIAANEINDNNKYHGFITTGTAGDGLDTNPLNYVYKIRRI